MTKQRLKQPAPARAPHGSLTEETAERLRGLIEEQHLAPGAHLREKELTEQLGVSRTPLREAFKILAREGLVELLPNKGARVAEVTLDEVREAFQVLAALEALAGELAAARATDADIAELRALHYTMVMHYTRKELAQYFKLNQAIHQKIVQVAGNGTLTALQDGLNGRLRWARYTANLPPDRWAQAVAEHEELMEAFAARDGKRLASLLRAHIMGKFDTLRHAFEASATSESAQTAS